MTNKIDEQDALMSRVDAAGFLDVCILLIKYTIQAIVELINGTSQHDFLVELLV